MKSINKRLLIGIIASIIITLIVSLVVVNESIKSKSIANQQISTFENSSYDFIVPNPAKTQIKDLQDNQYIDVVAPFYKVKLSVANINEKKHLTNILFFNSFEDIKMTMYNDKRVIKESDKVFENPILLDFAAANALNLNLEDEVFVNIGENNQKVVFQVQAIYEKNTYYDEGGVVALWKGEQQTAFNKDLKYAGAFLKCNNTDACFASLKSYKPLGIMRERTEFDSDVQYENYLEIFNAQNYSNEISRRVESLLQANNVYGSKASSASNYAVFAGIILLAVLIAVNFACFAYEKKNIEIAITQGESKGKIIRDFAFPSVLDAIICLIVGGILLLFAKSAAYISALTYFSGVLFAVLGVVVAALINIVVINMLVTKLFANKKLKTKPIVKYCREYKYNYTIDEIRANNTGKIKYKLTIYKAGGEVEKVRKISKDYADKINSTSERQR